MHPFIDPTLTGLKEESHHVLKRIDLAIEENEEQLLFHRSQTRFPSTTIPSLASFLEDMVLIHVGIVREGKGGEQFVKLCLIQAGEGTECARVVFEALGREHGGSIL